MDLTSERVVAGAASYIAHETPAALIRFGEGEGRVLCARYHEPGSIKVAANKLKRQMGSAYPVDDVLRIRSMLTRAFDRADIVGLRGDSRFRPEHDMWVKRIEALFAERVAAGRAPAVITHCQVNTDLLAHLGTLLGAQELVSVISSRDVRAHICSRYGVADVAVYPVPSQYVMREVDDGYEARLHNVPFWPDYYFDLRERIVVRRPGEVFLVGAGILGKELCLTVKERGGIALDMGSTLDAMVGKVTRGSRRPAPYRPVTAEHRSHRWRKA